MVKVANVAASLMEHLCIDPKHGYAQDNRWGSDEVCYVDVDGTLYRLDGGDRDCSSAVVDCYTQALYYTEYRGAIAGATYTGNMRKVFLDSGLFDVVEYYSGIPLNRGDVLLNDSSHTAMVLQSNPATVGEFSINSFGGIVGDREGDQTGNESHIRSMYNFPWNCVLKYNGKADTVDYAKRGELRLRTHINSLNQRWRAVYKKGTARIGLRNMETGRYIDVPDGKWVVNAKLGTYPPTEDGDLPNDAQMFFADEFDHGGVSVFRFDYQGLSIDVCNGDFSENAELQLYYNNNGEYPQAFLLVNVGTQEDPEVYIIVNMGTYKVITDVTV